VLSQGNRAMQRVFYTPNDSSIFYRAMQSRCLSVCDVGGL